MANNTTRSEAGDSTTEPPASQYQFSSSYGFAGTGTASTTRKNRRLGWLGILVPLALLVVWQTFSLILPSYKLPSPASVVLAGVDLAHTGKLGLYIAISVQRVVIGFLVGAAIGLVVGSWVGLSRVGRALMSPTLGAFRAVPSLAWVPLLVLYLGITESPKIILIAIGAFFPVYTTIAGALQHVDRQLVEVGRAYGLSPMRLLLQVQLPAVVPSIISGLRLALAQSWLFLVAAELISSSMGLGFLLSDSQNNGRIDRLFLAIILLGIFGKTTDALIGLVERLLLKRFA